MAKYNVEAGFTLRGFVEPEGYCLEPTDSRMVSGEFENTTNFYGDSMEFNGTIEFTIIAPDDEDEAARIATEILSELQWENAYGSDQIEWEIESTWIDGIEKVSEPMTKERARLLISDFLNYQIVSDDFLDALRFVLEIPAFKREVVEPEVKA